MGEVCVAEPQPCPTRGRHVAPYDPIWGRTAMVVDQSSGLAPNSCPTSVQIMCSLVHIVADIDCLWVGPRPSLSG